MEKNTLIETVSRLVTSPKGILAIDESLGTCRGRFEPLGVPFSEETRSEYREMLITAPDIEQYISGYILVEETAFQKTKEGVPFADILKNKGICMGITSNIGYELFNEKDGVKEEITKGLEDLPERMKRYGEQGAVFSKWREMIRIGGEDLPTENFLNEGARRLAQYALICQAEGIVPIVEPEILTDGDHSLEKCYEIMARNLDVVFEEFQKSNVFLPGVILKSSMVLPGKDSKLDVSEEDIANLTIKCLKEKVPEEIGGIVFLSGGQKDEDATTRLNEMHKLGDLPWPLTFSYGRAIQNPALQAWAKDREDKQGAQALLLERAKANSLASVGKYK